MRDDNLFLKLGSEIMFCDGECKGIERDLRNGIIPRVFILTSLNGENKANTNEKAKIGIFGINPSRHLPFENLFYREIVKNGLRLNNREEIFEKIHSAWVSEIFNGDDKDKLPYLKYFVHVKRFLKQISEDKNIIKLIGIKDNTTILWAEIVYCENESNRNSPFAATIQTCVKKYMSRVLDLISGDLIICLGKQSFEVMQNLAINGKLGRKAFPEISEKLNSKKILGIYHPSGQGGDFYTYFNKNGDKITQRNLKTEVKKAIKVFLRDEKILFLDDEAVKKLSKV